MGPIIYLAFRLLQLMLTKAYAIVGIPGYKKKNGEWFYVDYKVAVAGKKYYKLNVDKGSFKVLKNKKYAKDKFNTYYMGGLIKPNDPKFL